MFVTARSDLVWGRTGSAESRPVSVTRSGCSASVAAGVLFVASGADAAVVVFLLAI
jgi:hypothetical protein